MADFRVKTLRLSSFGIRGFTGESLTPEIVIDFASAFGSFADGGRVLVGRDTRLSSPMVHAGVTAGLLATGCEVLDLGICPTPILQFAVSRYQARGAIAISGGHMRMGWNALVLINANGACLDPVSGEAVLDIFHARDFRRPGWSHIGAATEVSDFAEAYFDALVAQLDIAAIRRANLTVAIDPVNGAACRFLAPFAQRLGFKLVAINAEEAGFMARDPEPRPRNARQVASILPLVHADVGFVGSSDFGRISIVTDEGETASEEYTFPLVADHLLRRTPGGPEAPVHVVGPLQMDLAAHLVTVAGREVALSATEFALLRVLVLHAGRVVTHKYLLRSVWGPQAETQSQYLRVYVTHLRRKLEGGLVRKLIRTEPGIGYRLLWPDAPSDDRNAQPDTTRGVSGNASTP